MTRAKFAAVGLSTLALWASTALITNQVGHADDGASVAQNCVTTLNTPVMSSDGRSLSATASFSCPGTIRIMVDHFVAPDYPIATATYSQSSPDPLRTVEKSCTPGSGAAGWVYTEVTAGGPALRSQAVYVSHCTS